MLALLALPLGATEDPAEVDAKALIEAAMEHWRGLTSYGEMTMTIHRPDWERSMSMRSWSQGDDNSLVRVTEPRKDAGNATLTSSERMWTYSPKINRVIKVPSSMMSQSWMGSDFSNNEVSKSTDILHEYDHRLLETYEEDGHTVYVIEGIPHEEAAVVWGKEIIHVRDDYVMIKEEFWDQDGILVKTLRAHEVEEMGGRTVATRMRMAKTDTPDEWTELRVNAIEFDIELSPNLFTLSNLRNPRE